MPERLVQLQSSMEQLETRLCNAQAELARLRRGSQPPLWTRLRNVAVTCFACVVLMAAADEQPKSSVRFRVVDSAGRKVFEVNDGSKRGFSIFDESGNEVLVGRALPTATFFKAGNPDGSQAAAMGLANSGSTPIFTMRYGGSDQSRLAMAVTDGGRPTLNMSNDRNIIMLDGGEGAEGGGLLMLTNAKGGTTVQMGSTATGVGAVTTFPNGGGGGAMLGLKGTFICGMGCAR